MVAAIAVVCTVCALPGPDRLSVVAYFSLLVPAMGITMVMILVQRRAFPGRRVIWLRFGWSLA